MSWNWKNVPLPEAHLLGLGLTLLGHWRNPLRLFRGRRAGLGWLFIAGGTLLAGWVVVTAGQEEIESASKLITSGPYAVSRNPCTWLGR